ncbi:ATP-dependent zinc protease [Aquisalimonas sp.]|uniref:ATP-dependent zinc protease family protein n=1 Tax=Aquisalimonas sp. TaxID=1872621 RepID=UPI0025BAA59D|nr:ATP-dependent zinc protease [Aquisalimonas sp.]
MQPLRSLFVLFIVPLALLLALTNAHAKSIFGWIERVSLLDGELTVEAKLDTGADTSSLNAPEPEIFEHEDEDWVRFSVKDSDGNKHSFERPVERMVRIRSASGTSRRPVIKMTVCLGDVERTAEVNLADREGLSYEMLIGRNFLKDHILVDSGPKFTRDPSCGKATEEEDNGAAEEDDDADDADGEDEEEDSEEDENGNNDENEDGEEAP